MMGANFEFGSHYDEYLFTYHSYRPDVDPAALEAPEACADARRAASVPRGALAVASQLHRPTPRPQRHRGASEAYDAFALAHGRRHSSRVEYLLRAAVFESVSAFVSSHNAASRSFSVAINRWADCTEEEFRRLVLLPRTASGIAAPPSGAASRGPAARALAGASAHRRLEGMIPGGVDWRGTGAITPVKDQASCGSCWSFAASGAIEGALFVGTGQSTSVSEQNLVDCSWDFEHAYGPYSSEGCDGGFFAMAMAYVKDKGIAPEADYPYIGQNGFCRRSPAGSPDVEPVK